MDLSIIVVNWNSKAYLEKCIASIYANTPSLDFEIIVVDNASFDGCEEMLASRFPQVRFIQSQINLGFAGANNIGYAHASGNALLFLNPDTEVVGNALASMWEALKHAKNAGAIGAKLLNSDGTIQTSCIQRFPTILNQAVDADLLRNAFPGWKIWGTWPLMVKQGGPVAVDAVSGACLLVSRDNFESVGLFSGEYFMYAEDVDLCRKLYQVGLSNYYVDDATVVHRGGASTSANGQSHFSTVLMRESLLKYFALRHGKVWAAAYRSSIALASLARCALLATVTLVPSNHDRHVKAALSRWAAILRWSLGLFGSTHMSPPAAHVPR
jgi:GT2 family glycosyltransferase